MCSKMPEYSRVTTYVSAHKYKLIHLHLLNYCTSTVGTVYPHTQAEISKINLFFSFYGKSTVVEICGFVVTMT